MALTPSQAKAMHTGSVSRVNRIRHGEYEVPGSLNGRTYRIRGTDPLALACDCPAGRLGRDCYHRAAVAIRITVERTLGSPRQPSCRSSSVRLPVALAPVTATSAPALARQSAIARPRPRLRVAPLTIATLPVSSFVLTGLP